MGMIRTWMLQRDFRRGRLADGLGKALFLALLAVLLVSVYAGLHDLQVS